MRKIAKVTKVTPLDLKSQAAVIPVSFEYDWKEQSLKDSCKWGSLYGTGTNSGLRWGMEDWNRD